MITSVAILFAGALFAGLIGSLTGLGEGVFVTITFLVLVILCYSLFAF